MAMDPIGSTKAWGGRFAAWPWQLAVIYLPILV